MDGRNFEFDFEKLKVYQKSLDFIHKMFEIYRKLLRDFKHSLGDNLIRAGVSIANNIAEGSGKKSKKEKARYYGTSLDSARECISVFNVLFHEGFMEKDSYKMMRFDGREITSMLSGLINSLE